METPEVPTEQTTEDIHHHAEHAQDRWIMRVALSSAIYVTFAAIASLLASHNADEAMLEQIKSSDHWAFYQAKSIKISILKSKDEVLKSFGKEIPETDTKKIEEYNGELAEIKKLAEEKEAESQKHLKVHGYLSRAVTLFQVAIAISAIAVLSRKRAFWFISIALSLFGLLHFLQGLLA